MPTLCIVVVVVVGYGDLSFQFLRASCGGAILVTGPESLPGFFEPKEQQRPALRPQSSFQHCLFSSHPFDFIFVNILQVGRIALYIQYGLSIALHQVEEPLRLNHTLSTGIMESPTTTEEDDQREATQLQEYDHATTLVPNGAMASSAVVSNPAANRKHGRIQSMQTSLQNFWERQVSATVLHDACRDHFGTPNPLLRCELRLYRMREDLLPECRLL